MTAGLDGHDSTSIPRRGAATDPTPGRPDPPATTRSRPTARDGSADSVIRQLFAISMTLASCAKTTDKFAATRVMQAIDELDHVISYLRIEIFDRAGTPEPRTSPHSPPG